MQPNEMRKTKKEKIEAQTRREKFLYSLSQLTKSTDNTAQTTQRTTNQMVRTEENFSYLKKDLLKILFLASLAFSIQIVLYLTIF